MGRYPTTTLAEKTGLRASIAREQVWGVVLWVRGGGLFRRLFCGFASLFCRCFRLFSCRLVDVDFGAEFRFDSGEQLLELALCFGNFRSLALNLAVEVVDDVVLFGNLSVQAVNDVVLFVHLAVEAVDDVVLLVDLSVESVDDTVLFVDLSVEGVDDTVLFVDLSVEGIDDTILFVKLFVPEIQGVVLFGDLSVECVNGAVFLGDLGVEGIDDSVLFIHLVVERVDNAVLSVDLLVQAFDGTVLFVDGLVLCRNLVRPCVEGRFAVCNLCFGGFQQVSLVFGLSGNAFELLPEFGVFFA